MYITQMTSEQLVQDFSSTAAHGVNTLQLTAAADITCKFCGICFDPSCMDIDPTNRGYWCEDCDGYNFFDAESTAHRFTLILESKASKNLLRPAMKVRLNKRLSPLRYPGGKSKIADYLYHKLNLSNTDVLVSPYSGGASVELALLHAGVVKRLTLNDLDYGVYALFEVIRTNPDALIARIRSCEPMHDDFYKAREIVKAGYLDCGLLNAAWSLLIVNRLAFSGIYYANPLGGAGGDRARLLARWNPDDLCRRITTIHAMSDRIAVEQTDACKLIEEAYWQPATTILIDPPYYKQGKNLYRCFYNEDDHIELNVLLESLYKGFPGADIILCYDDEEFIERLYFYPEIEKINRVFSV